MARQPPLCKLSVLFCLFVVCVFASTPNSCSLPFSDDRPVQPTTTPTPTPAPFPSSRTVTTQISQISSSFVPQHSPVVFGVSLNGVLCASLCLNLIAVVLGVLRVFLQPKFLLRLERAASSPTAQQRQQQQQQAQQAQQPQQTKTPTHKRNDSTSSLTTEKAPTTPANPNPNKSPQLPHDTANNQRSDSETNHDDDLASTPKSFQRVSTPARALSTPNLSVKNAHLVPRLKLPINTHASKTRQSTKEDSISNTNHDSSDTNVTVLTTPSPVMSPLSEVADDNEDDGDDGDGDNDENVQTGHHTANRRQKATTPKKNERTNAVQDSEKDTHDKRQANSSSSNTHNQNQDEDTFDTTSTVLSVYHPQHLLSPNKQQNPSNHQGNNNTNNQSNDNIDSNPANLNQYARRDSFTHTRTGHQSTCGFANTTTNELGTFAPHKFLVCEGRYASEFVERKCLGKGGFGEVFAVKHKLTRMRYAIKKVNVWIIKRVSLAEAFISDATALREVSISAMLSHPNIVRYYSSWLESESHSDNGQQTQDSSDADSDVELEALSLDDPKVKPVRATLYIQMELCQAGSLKYLLQTQDSQSTLVKTHHDTLRVMEETLLALHFIHSSGFVHQDIKPSNIFLQNSRVKLGDFGCSVWYKSPAELLGAPASSSSTAVPSTTPASTATKVPFSPSSQRQVATPASNLTCPSPSTSPFAIQPSPQPCGVSPLLLALADSTTASQPDGNKKVLSPLVPLPAAGTAVYAAPELGAARPRQRNLTSCAGSASRFSAVSVDESSVEDCVGNAGAPLAPSTDIYSLGLVFFELLSPRLASHAERVDELLRVRNHGLPSRLVMQFPKEAQLVADMLHKDPTKRPTAKQALLLLRAWRKDAPATA